MPATALRLLLALTLVFNGVTSAWAMVQACHGAEPANAVHPQPSPGALVSATKMQHGSPDMRSMMSSAHGMQGMAHAMKHNTSEAAGMLHRLCDGTCCKGMACPGHAPAGVALQPTLPRAPMFAAAAFSPGAARPATRAHPFTPPLRPPAN